MNNLEDIGRAIVIGVVLDAVCLAVSGLVLMQLWNWYMPVIFAEIPTLTLIMAIGLCFIISLIKKQTTPNDDRDAYDCMKDQAKVGILHPVVIFVYAGVFHLLFF